MTYKKILNHVTISSLDDKQTIPLNQKFDPCTNFSALPVQEASTKMKPNVCGRTHLDQANYRPKKIWFISSWILACPQPLNVQFWQQLNSVNFQCTSNCERSSIPANHKHRNVRSSIGLDRVFSNSKIQERLFKKYGQTNIQHNTACSDRRHSIIGEEWK